MTEIITDIVEELKHNSVLQTVKVKGFINSIGFELLAKIISYNKQIKTLRVFDIGACSADGTVHLIEALKHNTTLQNFSLRGVTLTVHQLELLANVLTFNTTLEKLEYSISLSKAELIAH